MVRSADTIGAGSFLVLSLLMVRTAVCSADRAESLVLQGRIVSSSRTFRMRNVPSPFGAVLGYPGGAYGFTKLTPCTVMSLELDPVHEGAWHRTIAAVWENTEV